MDSDLTRKAALVGTVLAVALSSLLMARPAGMSSFFGLVQNIGSVAGLGVRPGHHRGRQSGGSVVEGSGAMDDPGLLPSLVGAVAPTLLVAAALGYLVRHDDYWTSAPPHGTWWHWLLCISIPSAALQYCAILGIAALPGWSVYLDVLPLADLVATFAAVWLYTATLGRRSGREVWLVGVALILVARLIAVTFLACLIAASDQPSASIALVAAIVAGSVWVAAAGFVVTWAIRLFPRSGSSVCPR